MSEDIRDFYDEEPRPENYFFDDPEEIDWKKEIKELVAPSSHRLYCFPRVGMLTLGKALVQRDPWPAVISISSSTDLCPELSELGISSAEEENRALRLKFDDIGPEGKGDKDFPPYPISQKQAEEIVDFIEEWLVRRDGPVNFYIHCDAGVSRSQAVVKFILECFPDFPWMIYKRNPPLTPNAYVLSSLKRVLWERRFNEGKED